jgi:uncharacterized protein (DUF885 family)
MPQKRSAGVIRQALSTVRGRLGRPGRLFIDTYNATDCNLYAVEAIAYHEGLPGHHLQISIALELEDLSAFRKHQYYMAYTEG